MPKAPLADRIDQGRGLVPADLVLKGGRVALLLQGPGLQKYVPRYVRPWTACGSPTPATGWASRTSGSCLWAAATRWDSAATTF